VFGQPGGGGRRIQEIAARFREKGATSPEKAMTIEELGLPPRFGMAMHRRLGASGIFVEVSGKYYLDETRLQQFQQRRAGGFGGAGGGAWQSRQNMIALRLARMAVGIATILLVLANILFIRSLDVTAIVVTLFVVWVVLTVFQFYYLARMRSRWSGAGQTSNQAPQ
jgi:hypothetical protein